MRTLGKFIGRTLLVLIVVGVTMWFLGPYEDTSFETTFDESLLDDGVDAYLKSQEIPSLNIRENSEKRVIWAVMRKQRRHYQWSIYMVFLQALKKFVRCPMMLLRHLVPTFFIPAFRGTDATVARWQTAPLRGGWRMQLRH